ncbi:MAG: Wzz/FepE/Etk N-terminal domain-containing protein [Candidatus Sedimenticola sp. (ex Thyasira tokunagai)]
MDKANPLPHSQSPQHTPPSCLYYPQHIASEDEISLTDLWLILDKRKIIILVMTALVTLAALTYALTTTPTYKAGAIFFPPSAKDIQMLTVQGVQGVQGVYGAFKRNLGSRALHRRFFEEQGLIEILSSGPVSATSIEKALQVFSGMLGIKSNGDELSLSIEWRDPEQAAGWVNQLTAFVDSETVHQLASDLMGEIDRRIRDIENIISSKRQLAKQRREDRLVRLEEGLQIAESLGITDQQGVFNIVQNASSAGDASRSKNHQIYNRGIKGLQAEIAVLGKRKSDDAFITGLRDLQEELARLRSINVDETAISAVTVDQAAFPPSQPIKPKRRRIVVLGLLLGLMLGIFAAFFLNFLDNQRKEEEAVA